jgi:hypothetical protein
LRAALLGLELARRGAFGSWGWNRT